MEMGRKERKELVSATISQLEEVLPASGKPEELVKLTTAIVQSTKKLLEGTPEELLTKSTSILSEFVVAARLIAKDPRSVDASARQALSSSRKAVDALVRELNSWHDEKQGGEERVSEDVVLSKLASESVLLGSGNGAAETSSTSGGSQDDAAKEKELRDELKKEQIALWKKTEPQQAPGQHGKPSEVLTETTERLKNSAHALVEVASQKSPSSAALLEPALQLTRAVSVLLDLVDSIFISRYPMRSQVHGFCCTLVENSLIFGSQSRTEDASSLRIVTTEVPALLSAADVMITQSHKRAQDLEGQKKMSMQRSSDLQLLGSLEGGGGMMGVKKRGPPPKAPAATEKPKEEKEFEVICVLCTNVAVNQEDKKPMPKGTEVHLLAYSSTNILDIRRMLHTRTGIPRDSIEIKMHGADVLPDATKVKPNNPVPYFVFNINEPSDRELQEIRKIEKLNSRPKLEDLDWSQFSGPVAIALYDYDALGEEGNLNFDEGEVIEITEKSHDGWWSGRKEGVVGDFPASFVEEIEIPKTKEERKRLAQRFNKKSPDKISDDEGRASPAQKKLRKLQSNPVEPNSPSSSRAAVDRRVSEPVFSENMGKKDKKKLSLFKRRPGTQYSSLQEESGEVFGKKSPLSSDWRKKKVITSTSSWEDAMANSESPEMSKKLPLVKPTSSPKITKRKQMSMSAVVEGSSKVIRPRRPPPPVPNPLRATHVSVDTDEIARRRSEELSPEREGGEPEGERRSSPRSPPSENSSTSPELKPEVVVTQESSTTIAVANSPSPDSVKKSESMEELLKNLEEFDEVISSQNDPESPESEARERDFATIPRSELPVKIQTTNDERKSKSPSRTPEAVRKQKPVIPSSKPVQNGISGPPSEEPAQPKPTAPPRRKKAKMSQKLSDRMGVFENSSESSNSGAPTGKPAPPSVKPIRPAPKISSVPPPKPERDEKKRMKSRLEVMSSWQECNSAPVSRNASPDIVEDKLSKEGSASSEALATHPSNLAKRSPPRSPPSTLTYTAALKCISFLSDEDRVESGSLFKLSASSSRRVETWLSQLDKGDEPDLSNIPDTANATALLKSLLSSSRLGPLIQYPLAKSMCELVKSTSPVSVLGSQLEQLTTEHRTLLKELLRLFGLIINHSHKNMTEVADLNRMFGTLIFDRLPAAQTEQLLAYLVSTCELLIVS